METHSTYLIYHHKAWNWNDAHQRTGAPPGTVSSQCGSTERISTKTGSSAVVFYCEGATSSSCNPKPCEISIHNKKLSSQSTCVFHLFFLFSFFFRLCNRDQVDALHYCKLFMILGPKSPARAQVEMVEGRQAYSHFGVTWQGWLGTLDPIIWGENTVNSI